MYTHRKTIFINKCATLKTNSTVRKIVPLSNCNITIFCLLLYRQHSFVLSATVVAVLFFPRVVGMSLVCMNKERQKKRNTHHEKCTGKIYLFLFTDFSVCRICTLQVNAPTTRRVSGGSHNITPHPLAYYSALSSLRVSQLSRAGQPHHRHFGSHLLCSPGPGIANAMHRNQPSMWVLHTLDRNCIHIISASANEL